MQECFSKLGTSWLFTIRLWKFLLPPCRRQHSVLSNCFSLAGGSFDVRHGCYDMYFLGHSELATISYVYWLFEYGDLVCEAVDELFDIFPIPVSFSFLVLRWYLWALGGCVCCSVLTWWHGCASYPCVHAGCGALRKHNVLDLPMSF